MANSNGNSNGKVIEPEHLNYFSISNFKRFDFIELKDLGQFNLIVGDNNIGKTSILESLLFSKKKIDTLKNYHKTLCYRNVHIHHETVIDRSTGTIKVQLPEESYLSFLLNDDSKRLKINAISNLGEIKMGIEQTRLELLNKEEKKLISSITPGFEPKYWVKWFENEELVEVDWLYMDELTVMHNRYIPFISGLKGYASDLIDHFHETINTKRSKKRKLVEDMSTFINKIDDIVPFKVDERDIIGLYLKDNDDIVPLTRFGDGVVRLFRFLIEILKSENRRLMIDEITSGIHHSRLVDFWRVVIQSCVNNQVQLFATTHSNESLESFQKALELEELAAYQEKARVIRMSKMNDNSVKAYTMKFESFQTMLENGNEIRGWA